MKTRTVLASALALALALAGCRDNNASVEIFAICAPPSDAPKCGTSGSCSAFLADARLQVFTSVLGQANELVEFVEVRNQMPNNENLDVNRVNTNDFVAEEYLLSFRGVPGLADVTHPANFTVPANGSSTPVVPIIPVSTMVQLGAAVPAGATVLVIAEVRVRGHLIDGSTLETGVFEVAVDVTKADFTPAGCPTAGDVRYYCPNSGQTSSTACAKP